MINLNLDAKNLVASSELLSDEEYVFHTELRYCPFIVLDASQELYAESLILETKAQSYQNYNDALGALEGAKLELYRQHIAKYEDVKIFQNGDVP